MANKHANLEELFSAIADAIRVADDKIVGTLVADDFPEIISNIESGVNTDDADAEAHHIQNGKVAYVKGERVEGTLNPSPANIKTGVTIAGVTGTYTKVDSNAAAAANIETGKIAFVNGSQITGNLPNNVTTLTFSAATNNTSSSAIAIQSKHSSKFICNANTNMTTSVPYANIVSAIGLTAAKIADGENILGVTGTYTEESTSVAATAAQIQKDKVAYVNGARLVGTLAPAANTIKSGTTIAGVPGTLLATSTGSLTSAQILTGFSAYNSAGTLLSGSMASYSDTYKNVTEYGTINSSYIRAYIPYTGYWDTDSYLRLDTDFVLGQLGVGAPETGTVTTSWDSSVELGPFSTSPTYLYMCRDTTSDTSQKPDSDGAVVSVCGDAAGDTLTTALVTVAQTSDSTCYHGRSAIDDNALVVDKGGNAVYCDISGSSGSYYITLSAGADRFSTSFYGDYSYVAF